MEYTVEQLEKLQEEYNLTLSDTEESKDSSYGTERDLDTSSQFVGWLKQKEAASVPVNPIQFKL